MTELQQLLKMLERAGIGHGTRQDFNPPGTGVQIEVEDEIMDWWFDKDGKLIEICISDET